MQDIKQRMDVIRDVGRRIAAEYKVAPVLARLRLLRVSCKYVDLSLNVPVGTASEWMGARRNLPDRFIPELIRLEVRVANDLCHYIRHGEGKRLFHPTERDNLEKRMAEVLGMRRNDPHHAKYEEMEIARRTGRDGHPIYGAP